MLWLWNQSLATAFLRFENSYTEAGRFISNSVECSDGQIHNCNNFINEKNEYNEIKLT